MRRRHPAGPAAALARLAAGLGLAGLLAAAPAAARPVDLELVLAVDASSSVDRIEFDLQMLGLAEAFRHPKVHGALRAAGDLGIAVTLLQWSGANEQQVAVPWTPLAGAEDATALAARIQAAPRFVIGGGTAIGSALAFAAGLFEGNGLEGRRRVIDISGDGRANQGRRPESVREAAVAAGITINGVAILNEEWALDRYYRDSIIGGTGAFLMTATDFEDFARAIVAKLVREISGAPVAAAPPARPGAARVAAVRGPGRAP